MVTDSDLEEPEGEPELLSRKMRLRSQDVFLLGKHYFETLQVSELLRAADTQNLEPGLIQHEWGEGELLSWVYAWPAD